MSPSASGIDRTRAARRVAPRVPALAWVFVAAAECARAQQPQAPPPDPQAFAAAVEVIGVTPIHGVGLPASMVPANVQVLAGEPFETGSRELPLLLAERAASVHLNEVQAGTFQPDLQFRGFSASPLLGASEGLAIYQDGVRLNEPFGDTVQWDAIPASAIASINVIPGSNPLFGLNALGGALSIRTKDGFVAPGTRASVRTGSYGRHQAEVETGGQSGSFAYFVAGSLTGEAGWRDESPSTIRRLFADAAWRGATTHLDVSVTAASNDLSGNGPAPERLLREDGAAVFTHPDRTDNDLALVTMRGSREVSGGLALHGVAYYRRNRIGTFNGDAAEDDDDRETDEGPPFTAVNNISRTRGHAAGLAAQVTRTRPIWNRRNHLVAGAGVDAASTRFDFATEWAFLTPDRGTLGRGTFDDEARVELRSRVLTTGVFLTNTWSATERLAVTASARMNWTAVDLFDQLGTALDGRHRFQRVNPAAGVTYDLSAGVNLFGGYAQSSRVPTPVELTCADPDAPCRLPNAFVSDPPLSQVTARTWEAGARRTAGRTTWSVAAFTTAADDDIVFVSSGTRRGEGHFENVERTRRRGMEAAIGYDVPGRFAAFVTYTRQRATFDDDLVLASLFHPHAVDGEIRVPAGSRIPGVPAHSGKLGIAGTFAARLTMSLVVHAQSGQHLRGDEANLLAQVPGFIIAHVRGRLPLTGRLAITGHIQNLFGADRHTFGVLGEADLLGEAFEGESRFLSPGAPRGGWLGIEVRF